ncbi:uncharacterized protein LOC131648501 [Vicia villosa]|uniref:uncharacterized protein LOC131648501 n=1 Tax=Vicia villosa TaxID=3911 RepID=UPI00273B90D7|nr:uncharacterized protein LOC131648501 [Vicia villosa]
MKLKDIKEEVQKKSNVGVNKTKTIRARFVARDMVDGSFLGDCIRIYDYCHELLRSNPGSSVKLNVQPTQEAIGRDINDQMLPIAFAVVESENKDNWTWFLELFIDDLGGREECLTYIFIFDQQKSYHVIILMTYRLLHAIDELVPRVEQSVILESRAKPLITMMEEIWIYMMERWATNRLRFQKLAYVEVLPNIRRKIEKTSPYTNLWLARMFDEHIFEVRHLENSTEKFIVNLKSRNHKVDYYIPEYYMKSRYMEAYKPVILPVNGSNLGVRIEYPDVLPLKYRKIPERPKKRRNLEQSEIDGSDRKMRRNGFNVKCSRCKKEGHNKLICKVPTQASQQVPSQTSQQVPSQTSQQTSQQAPNQVTQKSKQVTQQSKKLLVRRSTTPFIPPGPTTRLNVAKTIGGPTPRRTTLIKRSTPIRKILFSVRAVD